MNWSDLAEASADAMRLSAADRVALERRVLDEHHRFNVVREDVIDFRRRRAMQMETAAGLEPAGTV